MSQRRTDHLTAVHHFPRYPKSYPGQSLLPPANSTLQLLAFADADSGYMPRYKETGLNLLHLPGRFSDIVESKGTKHCFKVVCHAKYCAIATTTSEVIWLTQLLEDFKVLSYLPSLIFYNNQATI